ncbi:hypothetical protein [Rossellomorea sp. BNER]|uniref:hypothetical protein n=1 Tax=Rossellomorea sp. BNER TaxID=2962031 RepID=UPI003AF25DD0|nr:hypothetical protein [Rossellomorea sp. BNER]
MIVKPREIPLNILNKHCLGDCTPTIPKWQKLKEIWPKVPLVIEERILLIIPFSSLPDKK